MMKRQLDDFVGLTDERVKEAIDIRRIWLWVIRRCERATLRSVRAAVDDARATYNKSQYPCYNLRNNIRFLIVKFSKNVPIKRACKLLNHRQ